MEAQERGPHVEACGTQVLWCGVAGAFPSWRSVVRRGGEVCAALCVLVMNNKCFGKILWGVVVGDLWTGPAPLRS